MPRSTRMARGARQLHGARKLRGNVQAGVLVQRTLRRCFTLIHGDSTESYGSKGVKAHRAVILSGARCAGSFRSRPLLRRASQCDDRKMAPAFKELHFERESITGVSGNERARFGTGGASRPPLARLDAWTPVLRSQPKVDLVGRSSVKGCVRSMLVVPGEE